MTYMNSDLRFSAFLVYRGYKIIDVTQEKGKKDKGKGKMSFTFELPEEDIVKKVGIEFQNSEILGYLRVMDGLRSMMLDYGI